MVLITAFFHLQAAVLSAPRPMKDQDRIIGDSPSPLGPGDVRGPKGLPRLRTAPDMLSPDDAPPQGPAGMPPPEMLHGDGEPGAAPDEGSLQQAIELERMIREEIPNIEAVELSDERAKKALDALEAIYGKYDDAGMDQYPTLQEFADKTEAGRKMQEEIRRFGFRDVTDWNIVIMNLGFAFTAEHDGADDSLILAQIRAVEKNANFTPARKKELVRMLKALIPSPNNRAVVRRLMNDPVYAKKLELLDGEEDGGE